MSDQPKSPAPWDPLIAAEQRDLALARRATIAAGLAAQVRRSVEVVATIATIACRIDRAIVTITDADEELRKRIEELNAAERKTARSEESCRACGAAMLDGRCTADYAEEESRP